MDNNNKLLMRSLNIPYFENMKEFSRLIGLSPSLLYCLSNMTERYYKTKSIPKKNGELRTIYIPSYTLKIVQRWILENILNKLEPTKHAMAFRNNKGDLRFDIRQNAYIHSDSLYGLTIDLKDFFPSIASNKVYTLFRNIGFNVFASSILTNLCTFEGKLPQGAVCSPSLSNLVCVTLDRRLEGLCERRGILYTRYADDMYFSCDNKILLLRFYPVIRKIIESEGFIINENKVHYQTRKNKKIVTGVTVSYSNETPELKAARVLKKKIRSEIFHSIMSGNYSLNEHIQGEIAYVNFIEDGKYLERIKKYINKTVTKIIYFSELVEKYNENLFYPDMDEQTAEPISSFEVETDCKFEDEDKHYEVVYFGLKSMFDERKSFLKKNGIQDICKYEDWPKSITNK